MEWEVVIGLETHTQLQTKTKIFSGASTAFGSEPNTQACEVSLAFPGVLPVLNKEAVNCAIKFGLAVNAQITPRSVFARKNYFYPDLPKGYQISQYELPVVGKGMITIQVPAVGKNPAYEKVVNITRAHLEEDAGKSVHGAVEGMSGIDLNRAGTPLLEIVTEPDMRSAAEAVAYAKKLHELVQWIGICDGNMQEGSFRCDVNVSVRPKGTDKLGTRREIKNLNSFKFMQQAIEFETRWQIETLEDGGTISQATVLFNPDTGETRAMRSKEEANDYRYFPDPDLLPLEITEADKDRVRAQMPELPEAMKARFEADFGLTSYDAASLTSSLDLANYFVATVHAGADAKPAANWVMGAVSAKLNAEEKSIAQSPLTAVQLASLIKRIMDNTISNNAAKQVFEALWNGEGGVDAIIEAKGLKQVSDTGAIEAIIDEVLAANAAMVEEFKAGKEKAFNALVGQAMKASKGKANPAQVNEMLKKKLGA
ncbi:MAG: aspartyl/glutamyl-tRNA amidotransferase subunit B [Methylotenera sp. 24-45-7]|jgi:aspartyl-tRNA(Asn)/glutamyl-tRNA(Gln) amidotransferase subunit B|nr:MAG: aspartyl/glutamyl-tRNA amidotransferase subunit B [Mehylophilales bacterium 35-46-6]OYZ41589.1 MAG: aspartyl/glutamyl-tRNA amidotransferase subunit B [Methylotenera sp. 24-45-7]OZA08602.1 MAG: aspartyl/glutamyl-tRNA amidotransferase subunit B [Methylotenera sp. 17-45-7]OZA54626.1 MAG: aspartyl/glutamyl-tRNA amidotransferase subunit B [Methylophilales bacterium 39-45-7]HQS36660.1 Asp-tRNA(Asn)/Glu-tRNA(Gln) amidotransferase subunit GatB [Methylotenera sp.]